VHRVLTAVGLLSAGCPKPADYPHDGGLAGQLEAELIALKLTNRSLRDELRTCADGSLPSGVFSSLTQLFRGTEVEVLREGSAVVLRLPTAMIYADAYALRPRDEARPALDLLATALRVNPGPSIEVHGYTDNGILPPKIARRYRTQTELSYFQAAALGERLVREFGVEEARLAVVAHGGNLPLASNDTPEGTSRNQRLEIHLVPAPLDP
jgi:flagellar motor protein MotB